MSTLYLIKDDNSGHYVDILPSKKAAAAKITEMGDSGEGAGSIHPVNVVMTRDGICAFINQHFGNAIFEHGVFVEDAADSETA